MKKLWLHKYCVDSNLFAMIAVLYMQLRGNSRIYRVCISKENSKTDSIPTILTIYFLFKVFQQVLKMYIYTLIAFIYVYLDVFCFTVKFFEDLAMWCLHAKSFQDLRRMCPHNPMSIQCWDDLARFSREIAWMIFSSKIIEDHPSCCHHKTLRRLRTHAP